MGDFDVTPEQASRGRSVPDRDLSMLAAHWLAAGHDSPSLRTLAALDTSEINSARALFEQCLDELGFPQIEYVIPYDEAPWRGYWGGIEWVRQRMDNGYAPYAVGQRVLEILDDVPDLWDLADGYELQAMLANRNTAAAVDRPAADDRIRQWILSLTADDIPALRPA